MIAKGQKIKDKFQILANKIKLKIRVIRFIIVALLICVKSCLSKGNKINFYVSDQKYFILYEKNILFPEKVSEQVISIETNFPDEISVVISTGIFGNIRTIPMECQRQKHFICKVRLKKQFLEKENYFWFMLKTQQGYYHVPNMLITKDLLFEKLGRIEVER